MNHRPGIVLEPIELAENKGVYVVVFFRDYDFEGDIVEC